MNVYPTARAVGEPPRRTRFVDWRFLASLTALLLVVLIVFGAWRNYEIREAEAEQKDRLLLELVERSSEIDRLEDRLDRVLADSKRERRANERERRAARQERAELLRQQEVMLRLLRRYGAPRAATVTRYALTSSPPSTSSAPTSSGATSPRQSADTQRVTAKKPKKRTTAKRKTHRRPTAGKSGKRPGGKAKGLRRR